MLKWKAMLSGDDGRLSIPYQLLPTNREEGRPRKGLRRSQWLLLILTIAFVSTSVVLSLFSETSLQALARKISISNGRKKLTSTETNSRALTWEERNDRTWPESKCRQEFPLLFPQLEEVADHWRERGGMTKEIVDRSEREVNERWGYSRLIIRNGKVYIRSFKEGGETRNSALLHLITMAVNSSPRSHASLTGSKEEALPPIDMIFSPGDKDTFPDTGGWTVAKNIHNRNQDGNWLLPDFGFVAWPEAGAGLYEDFLELASDVEKRYPWAEKQDKVFWRGWAGPYAPRRDMLERTSTLIDTSRKEWADVHETTFHGDSGNFYPIVSLPNHCQHKYLIHTEGNSYSGRSKYLFSCRSVTIAHPLEWTQHFHPALNPDPRSVHQNLVQLPGPHFSQLEEVTNDLRRADSDRLARRQKQSFFREGGPEQIADNAARTLRDRYLTPAATMCYIRTALRLYADVQITSTWGPTGPELIPGQGVAPDSSKNRTMSHLQGDIESGVWRLLGGPDWPPVLPAPASAAINSTGNSTFFSR